MSLEDVFAPFPAALAELGYDTLTFAGPDGVSDTAAPPRITWFPLEDEQLAPKRMGGGPGDDGPILTNRWHIQVDVWGEDFAAAEALRDAFLATAHALLSQHSYRPGKGRWNFGGVTSNGIGCHLLISIEKPILRVPARTVTLQSIRASMGIASGPPATPVVSTFTKET